MSAPVPPEEPVERTGLLERALDVSSPPEPAVRPALGVHRHIRAAVLVLALTILVGGLAYPAVVTGIAQVIAPTTANGSLLYGPNGTAVGSSLVAQNLTSFPFLFWARPSLADYQMALGAPQPPGPSDPALVNETRAFMALYGNGTVNATLPLWLVSPSGSSVDPDLVPEAVLVQIPRVAAHWPGLTEEALRGFVNARVQPSPTGFVGTDYVNVLELDLDLLHAHGRP